MEIHEMEIHKVPEGFLKEIKPGITSVLRKVNVGEMIYIGDKQRKHIYRIADNIDIQIRTKKMDDGRIAVVRVA